MPGPAARGVFISLRFDPTINYGHILTALTLIIAGAGASFGMRAELQNVDLRVAKLEWF